MGLIIVEICRATSAVHMWATHNELGSFMEMKFCGSLPNNLAKIQLNGLCNFLVYKIVDQFTHD